MKITIPTRQGSLQIADIFFFPEIQSSKSHSLRERNTGPSSNNEYRHLLRQKLSEHLRQIGETRLDPSLLDLNKLPNQKGWSMSLSHCPQGSAFVALASPNRQVGLDVEALDRLSQPIIDRIAKPTEQNTCPVRLHLFSAKEAAWKALNQTFDVPTLAHFETLNWTPIEENWWSFKVQFSDQVLDGQGFSTEIGPVCMALFLQN